MTGISGGVNDAPKAALETVKKKGAAVIFSSSRGLDSLEKNLPDLRFGRFAVVSGNFPASGIAIPLVSRRVTQSALKQLYLYKGKSWVAKVKIKFLEWGVPLLKFILRNQFSITVDESKDNFISFLASVLGLNAKELDFSIYAGSRKFLLPLLRVGDGKLIGFTKVYFPERESAKYGENEASVLEKLAKMDFRTANAPKVIFKGHYNGFFLVILSPGEDLENFNSIAPAHTDFLKELSRKTGKKLIFESSPFPREFEEEISFLKSKIREKAELIGHFYEEAKSNLSGKNFLFTLTMREFPFFQLMRGRGKNFIVDWELARWFFPPIFDAFSLLLSTERRGGDYIRVYADSLKGLFFGKNRKTDAYLRPLLEFWQLSREESYWFFWLFLLDQLYIHLHVGHDLSASRVVAFLEEVRGKEREFQNLWISR